MKEKLKCLVFIPIISRTYCDPKSFAWEHEFKAFVEQASKDKFGLKVKLPSGNVANRVLPVRIHDLDNTDIKLCESILGGFLRGIEFIYREPGVNRPLTTKDNEEKNINHTNYRNQINKVALAIRDIIESIRIPNLYEQVTDKDTQADVEERLGKVKPPEIKKHNLPISTTSFVGREKEMKEVRDLFQKSRLITLTGAGGCGKTRLAREIASTLIEEFKDGVWFVNLSPITNPEFIAKSIAEVLSIKEEPDKPIIETLINKISDKSLLILLDNCEHLIQACAEIVDKLLQSVEGIRILATSREALNIYGEVVWMIPSLSFPAPDSKVLIDETDRYESIKLFTDRAALGKPGFKVNTQNVSIVAQICSRMEGIPLAIELAATRIKHLGPETILERLEDQFKILSSSSRIAPGRQQTLKAAIDWSYDLLSEQEQLLFNRLSVFAGDFSLDAAEEVCQDNKLLKEDILFHLSQLVDKSLIIANSQVDGVIRYRFLEPIHQYSLQKLIAGNEEADFRKKHLEYYLKMAKLANEEQFDSEFKWMNNLEHEHDNIIAALNWSFKLFEEEFVLLSGYMAWFWRNHSQIILAIDYLEKALSKVTGKSEAYAQVVSGLGRIYSLIETGDRWLRANNFLNQGLTIWRQLKNPREEAIVLSEIGYPYFQSGDFKTALGYIEESLELARKVESPGLVNYCLSNLCQLFVHSKNYERGKPLVEELLISSQKLGQPLGIYSARHYQADCAQGMKEFKEAEKRYGLAIETALNYGYVLWATTDLQGVAFALSGQSRWAKSIRLNSAANEKYRDFRVAIKGMMKFWDEWIENYLEGASKKAGKELTRKYEEEGRRMGFESAIRYALDFDKD